MHAVGGRDGDASLFGVVTKHRVFGVSPVTGDFGCWDAGGFLRLGVFCRLARGFFLMAGVGNDVWSLYGLIVMTKVPTVPHCKTASSKAVILFFQY